jgi:hypothetical protein
MAYKIYERTRPPIEPFRGWWVVGGGWWLWWEMTKIYKKYEKNDSEDRIVFFSLFNKWK